MTAVQKVIYYEQIHHREQNESPRDYYDPHVFIAEKQYFLAPQEEVLIVICGSGYRFKDDTICLLDVQPLSSSSSSSSGSSGSSSVQLQTQHNQQLCILVKNTSPYYSIYVGCKSPLFWLLDMPRISSRFCYCSYSDLTVLKLNQPYPEAQTDSEPNLYAEDESIIIHY